MPERNPKLYLEDIKTSIRRIEKFTKGFSFKDFQKNILVVDAVVRNLEIIGEATKHIPEKIRIFLLGSRFHLVPKY